MKAGLRLHVDTAETSTTSAYDKLSVQVLNNPGAVLSTLHTYTNLDDVTGYEQHTFAGHPRPARTSR